MDGLAPSKASRNGALNLAERILKMFYAWPTVRLDDDKAIGVATAYASQVEHLPIWAVEAGIRECQGRKTAFPPSAGELKAACETKVTAFEDELIALQRILNAEIYEPTKHGAEAIERVRRLAATAIERSGATHPLRREDYQRVPDADAARRLEEFEARRSRLVDHDAPLQISETLRKNLEQVRTT